MGVNFVVRLFYVRVCDNTQPTMFRFTLLTSTACALMLSPRRLQEDELSPECLQSVLLLMTSCPTLNTLFSPPYDYDAGSGDAPFDIQMWAEACQDPACATAIQGVGSHCEFEDEDGFGFGMICFGDCDSVSASNCVERCSGCIAEGAAVDALGSPCDTCMPCIEYMHCIGQNHDEEDDDKDDPCFPADARVTLATGRSVRVDALRPGDAILAATQDGNVVADRVSPLSIVNASSRASKMVTLGIGEDRQLRLTPAHRVATGDECCDTLLPAGDLTTGDVVWIEEQGRVARKVVSRVVHGHDRTTLHSPVLERGALPLVEGVVTSPGSAREMWALHHLGGLLHSHPLLVRLARQMLSHNLPTMGDA